MRNVWVGFAGMLVTSTVFAQPALHMKGLRQERAGTAASLDSTPRSRTPARSHFLLQFGDNPTPDQLNDLSNRGVNVLSYVPDFTLSVSVGDGTSLDGLNLVSIVQLYPDEKISPELYDSLASAEAVTVLVEFYKDVDPNGARAIANDAGLTIQENPDLMANHLLLSGTPDQILALTNWDEVSYIFPGSSDLLQGTPVQGCAGALTSMGAVGQSILLVGDGWDGPGRGGADLNYTFVHLTDRLPADSAKAEIVRAFSEWAKYAKLTFTPADDKNAPRTLAILFASRDHGDGYPFDGPNGILAHTFYPFPVNPEPIAGNMHFDDDESWKIGANVDLFSIALHEAGHALGLGHSDKPGDVMYPYYGRTNGLTQNDINAVLQLYAAQSVNPDPLTLVVQVPVSPTTASTIALSGTASGGSGAIKLVWSSNRGASGIAQGSLNWSIANIALSAGDNVITITAVDAKQNQVIRTLTITRQVASVPQQPAVPPVPDSTPPSLSIGSPSTNRVSTSAGSVVVSGTARDNVNVALVTWSSSTGGSGTASGTDNWSTPPIPLYLGTTTITIRASDAAGNTNWRSVTFTRR
jgi:Matrixin